MSNILLIISGPPCTGKTTLGRKIAAEFHLPFISRDDIKEALFDSLGIKDRAWSKKLGGASYTVFYKVIESLLSGDQPFIAETNFKPEFADKRFQELQKTYKFTAFQILCKTRGSTLFERFKNRSESGERHPGHVDDQTYKDGSFLDVGCANGYLIECLQRWVEGSGLNVAFYGVDISEELIDFAQKRLPDRSNRFFVANAVSWVPDRKFDFVHAHEISYAPENRERQFLEHLLEAYLNPGGRLIIGPWAVYRDFPDLEERISSWGYEPTGYLLKSQGNDRGLTRKMIWFDKA